MWPIGLAGRRTIVVLPAPWISQYRRSPSFAVAKPVSSGRRARAAVSVVLLGALMPGHPLPQRVHDPPAVGRADEMEVLVVDRGADDRARDVVEDVDDVHLDAAVGDVARPADALRRPVDHLPGRERSQRLAERVVDAAGALRELWVERALHPRRVAVEPALEVVEHRALDRLSRACVHRRLPVVDHARHRQEPPPNFARSAAKTLTPPARKRRIVVRRNSFFDRSVAACHSSRGTQSLKMTGPSFEYP